MRQILSREGVRLTRSLGQNFLHDANQLQRIVAAADLQPGEQVLEIGPGLGALTEWLILEPVNILAIEVDRRLFDLLRTRFPQALIASQGPDDSSLASPAALLGPHGGAAASDRGEGWTLDRVESPPSRGRLILLLADALEFLRAQPRDWHEWKLVANLPYSVASPILVELALNPQGPKQMTVTLQWEVVQRLLARPGSADYGVLTLLIQLDYLARDWYKIPAGCFFPAPEVDSACVTLCRREKPLLEEGERTAFVRLVKQGFSQRRKMLRKLLKALHSEAVLDKTFLSLGLASTVRGEELSLEQWVDLTRQLGGRHV